MDSILCTLDLSPDAGKVAAWAAAFSRRQNMPLTVMHAIHAPSDPIHPSAEFERGGDLALRRSRGSKAIENIMASIEVPWCMEIVFGDPAEMVQQYCRTHHVALVVAGSRGIRGVRRYLLGTVVERMARMLPCPMLVVRPSLPAPPHIRRIGVCCDLGAGAHLLVEKAAALAKAFEAELHLYSALESALDINADARDQIPYNEAQRRLQAHRRDCLTAMVPEESCGPLKTDVHLAFGDSIDEMPALVNACTPDLLLVGVRNRSTLGQWMAGSTTEALLRRARCPVLAVPVKDLQKKTGEKGRTGSVFPRKPTGIVRDDAFLAHRSPGHHPENHQRLESIYAMLDKANGSLPLSPVPVRAATLEELTQVHDLAHVLGIAGTSKQDYTQLTPDTYACAHSYAAASRAAGAVMAAIDAVVDGKVRNAFVPVRPPGHHAEIGRAMGFCLFNNVALGAEYARAAKGLSRVLIVDWDLHHGNGIQHIFEEDPSVLYISTHQYPCFPGTGHYLEVGRGRGEGYTMNLPLGKGWRDADYAALFRRLVAPVAVAFKPDLIIAAAGFDIHSKDPVGRMQVSEAGFAALTRILMDAAHACCRERLVLVLEGGYHPEALASSVKAVLAELSGQTHADIRTLAARARSRRVKPVVKRCVHVLGHVWPCLFRSGTD